MSGSYRRPLVSLLRHFGVDLLRYPQHHAGYKRVLLLQHYGIDLVLDVGANDGGYGKELRRFGYAERLVSFEPLAEPYARLRQVADRDGGWSAYRLALGGAEQVIRINVAGNSTSSSFLAMHDTHRLAAPWAGYVGVEEVTMVRLDDVFDRHCGDAVPFLKMDVQGYEEEVLAGGKSSVPRLRGVQVELSLVPLYEGAWSFFEALGYFQEAGFELVSLEPGFYDRATGRLLQVDGIFMQPR